MAGTQTTLNNAKRSGTEISAPFPGKPDYTRDMCTLVPMPEQFQRTPAVPRVWDRESSLRALMEPTFFDLVVIGGGVIGASAARDASGRGLSVALIEQNDFAGGASGKSTKLIHGGIRYLPHLRLGLVRQGLAEQAVLRHTADYLYSDLDFVIPLFKGQGLVDLPQWVSTGPLRSFVLGAGLHLYDRLGGRRSQERHRSITREEVLDSFPRLYGHDLMKGITYRDAQTDDARLTITLLKTAVTEHGAVAVSRVRAMDVATRSDGLEVTVQENGESHKLRSRSVIAATWASPPPFHRLAATRTEVRFSKGVHLVYRPEDLGVGGQALVLPQTDDGRLLFIIPWRGLALLGTTDTPYEGDPDRIRPEKEDVNYLQRHLERHVDCSGASPVASFAGLRILPKGRDNTASASRGHRIIEHSPGVFAVQGGKLTTARAIASDVVDQACAHLAIDTPSRTGDDLLAGSGTDNTLRSRLRTRLKSTGLPAGYSDRLIERYGTDSVAVLNILRERPALGVLLEPVPITLAEAAYTARCESVTTVGDFALRRTNLAWSCSDHGRKWAPLIATTLADELGWSRMQTDRAVQDYEEELIRLEL